MPTIYDSPAVDDGVPPVAPVPSPVLPKVDDNSSLPTPGPNKTVVTAICNGHLKAAPLKANDDSLALAKTPAADDVVPAVAPVAAAISNGHLKVAPPKANNDSLAFTKTPVIKKARAKKPPPTNKCSIRGCERPVPDTHGDIPMVKCDAVECSKMVHIICYKKIISNSNYEVIPGKSCCTIGCHKNYLRDYSSLQLNWKNDGKDGRTDSHHSEYYLIEWMASDGNIARWRKPGNGMTKIQLCSILSQWLVDQGVKMKHTQEQVKNKIEWIERCMRQSFDWENSVTGAGIRDRDGATTFKQTIIDKCPFYFYLKDLFADRAGFKPLATSLNLFFE